MQAINNVNGCTKISHPLPRNGIASMATSQQEELAPLDVAQVIKGALASEAEMAREDSYMVRQDVGDLNAPVTLRGYFVKIFEDEDLTTLQDTVNTWLISLPRATTGWVPHIAETHLHSYEKDPPQPGIRHVMTLVVYVAGTEQPSAP